MQINIGRGWAKYHDLSVVSRSVSLIIDLRDTDKSQYYTITKFKNSFHNIFNHSLTAQGRDLPITHELNIICSKTHLDTTTNEQTIINRQLPGICSLQGALSANEMYGKTASNVKENYGHWCVAWYEWFTMYTVLHVW